MVGHLHLRAPQFDDEPVARAAQRELAAERFDFGLWPDGEPWPAYLARLGREEAGIDLPPGRVPGALRYAEVDGQVVGRLSVRFALSPVLTAVGGHVGYAVRPAFRGRGHGHAILAAALELLAARGIERVLLTCDEDNPASRAVIEAAGGGLDPQRRTARDGAVLVRRYWIDRTAPGRS